MRVRSDEQLARQAAAGDQRAFAAIYSRHHDALYRYCLTIVRDPDDAKDVLQSVMANALTALGKGVPDAPIKPWLFRITHNEAVSALRRRRPSAELRDDALAADLEATVDQRARLRQLVVDLRALPERQRGALVMRELSGLSHADIAAALGISAPQAKQAILEARVSLQEAEKGRALRCPDVRTVISERDGRRLRARSVRAHLRGCDDCRALRDAIATREADLRVLAPPLPAAAGVGLLASLLGGGSVSLTAKGAIGLAVIATAGAGVEVAKHRDPKPERASATRSAKATAAPSDPTSATATATATTVPVAATETATSEVARVRHGKAHVRKRRRLRPGAGAGTPAPSAAPDASVAPTTTVPAQPTKTAKPAKTAKPVKTPKPAKTPKPVKTPKPAKTPKPVKTPKPAKTPKPTATPRPTASPKPTSTPKPVKTPNPNEKTK